MFQTKTLTFDIIIITYISCHPRTDYFVISQLFSVARHVGRFLLGSKPDQLYVRLSILSLSHQVTYVSSGIVRHYVVTFVCLYFALPDIRVFTSLEELCITRVAAQHPLVRERIYCHITDRLFWCITTLQCG